MKNLGKHCWHRRLNPFASRYRCCFCGKKSGTKRVSKSNPEHGRFQDDNWYEVVADETLCLAPTPPYEPKWPNSGKPDDVDWPVWDFIVDLHEITAYPGVVTCSCGWSESYEGSAQVEATIKATAHRREVALGRRAKQS